MAKTDKKIPPQAIDAEMAVLGSMLIEKDAVERALEIVDTPNFYLDTHQIVFDCIKALFNKNRAVDLVTLTEELKKRKKLNDIGGEAYLSELVGKVSTAAHVGHYAEIVYQKAILRDLIKTATSVVENCYDQNNEPETLVDSAQEQLYAISQKQILSGFHSAKELSQEVMEIIEKVHMNKAAVTGVPTGFSKFDEMTGGLQKSDLIILAARPSQGKTAMALNMAYHMAVEKKVPVAIFSIEMDRHAIFERMVCSASLANLHQVRTGMFKREKWADLTRELAKLANAPLWIDDSPGLTINEIRMRARRLASDLKKQGKELGMVVIDYLQLIQVQSKRNESRQQEVSEISRRLKELARTLDMPVLALSQLNRRSEEKSRDGNKPQLSDLRESGSLEQDADVVALIHREEFYKREDPTLKGVAKLIIAKQRNGPIGEVDLAFIQESTRFADPVPRSIDIAEETTVM
jgi:replicative DNA helicase